MWCEVNPSFLILPDGWLSNTKSKSTQLIALRCVVLVACNSSLLASLCERESPSASHAGRTGTGQAVQGGAGRRVETPPELS